MEQNQAKSSSSRVKIVVVRAGLQPFGLLMSQVYNIMRPGSQGFTVINLPTNDGFEGGEIEYREQSVRVIELARLLQLPLIEPLAHSRILLSVQSNLNGQLSQAFGLACDEVLNATSVALEELKPLPGWLFQKRLGRLIWAAVLLERSLLMEQPGLVGLDNSVLLEALADYAPPREIRSSEERRPVMLLDLEVLRRRLFEK